MSKIEELRSKGWIRKETVWDEFAEMLSEDINKYGVVDKEGVVWIDDGIQKTIVGNFKQ